MRTGMTALGCTSSLSSRRACRTSSSVRNILMPPPVDPVLQVMQLRNSSQIGSERRPLLVVLGDEAGGRGDRDDVEGRMAQRVNRNPGRCRSIHSSNVTPATLRPSRCTMARLPSDRVAYGRNDSVATP